MIAPRLVRISTHTTYSMAHQETRPIPAIRIRLCLSKDIFEGPKKLFPTQKVWLM